MPQLINQPTNQSFLRNCPVVPYRNGTAVNVDVDVNGMYRVDMVPGLNYYSVVVVTLWNVSLYYTSFILPSSHWHFSPLAPQCRLPVGAQRGMCWYLPWKMTPLSTTSVSVVTSWQLAPRALSNVLTWHPAMSQQVTENRLCEWSKLLWYFAFPNREGGGGDIFKTSSAPQPSKKYAHLLRTWLYFTRIIWVVMKGIDCVSKAR